MRYVIAILSNYKDWLNNAPAWKKEELLHLTSELERAIEILKESK